MKPLNLTPLNPSYGYLHANVKDFLDLTCYTQLQFLQTQLLLRQVRLGQLRSPVYNVLRSAINYETR